VKHRREVSTTCGNAESPGQTYSTIRHGTAELQVGCYSSVTHFAFSPRASLSEMPPPRPTLLAVTAGTWRTASEAFREDDQERDRIAPSIEIQTSWRDRPSSAHSCAVLGADGAKVECHW
jgi:hypothetical protein